MASLDKSRIFDPRTRIKLNLDSNEMKSRITTFTDSMETSREGLTSATKHSSRRIEKEIKSLENLKFNPIEAISKVLGDSKKSHKLNSVVTKKVYAASYSHNELKGFKL